MMKFGTFPIFFVGLIFSFLFHVSLSTGQESTESLDAKVQKFLDAQKGTWNDLNVPYEDGKALYDIIVKNNYKSALEIGTSTGHSSIWIARALSKTGGRLITIEIDKERHEQALKNFKEAGVSQYIDARLADAHQLVKTLPGPFDFVFSDADKEWYTNYFKDIDPKLKIGGRFTAHNVSQKISGIQEFLDHVRSQSNYETTILTASSSGISVSYKKSE